MLKGQEITQKEFEAAQKRRKEIALKESKMQIKAGPVKSSLGKALDKMESLKPIKKGA